LACVGSARPLSTTHGIYPKKTALSCLLALPLAAHNQTPLLSPDAALGGASSKRLLKRLGKPETDRAVLLVFLSRPFPAIFDQLSALKFFLTFAPVALSKAGKLWANRLVLVFRTGAARALQQAAAYSVVASPATRRTLT